MHGYINKNADNECFFAPAGKQQDAKIVNQNVAHICGTRTLLILHSLAYAVRTNVQSPSFTADELDHRLGLLVI